jgi:hypothetical protein
VNVATDESQQTNVVKKAKKKAKSRDAQRFRGRKLEVVKSNS